LTPNDEAVKETFDFLLVEIDSIKNNVQYFTSYKNGKKAGKQSFFMTKID
jgi:hypothetical protein